LSDFVFARIDSCKKLQVLFLRSSGLTDADMSQICVSLKTNSSIKVLDISSNRELTVESAYGLCDVMTANRALEYLGMSKLNLAGENVVPLFEGIGRFPFPAEDVENQLAELKKRDAIIEKNKKLKASKKAEEPVPQLDNIEQITKKNDEGEEVQEWVTIKNPQFKHLNICMNNIEDDVVEALQAVLDRTTDDFGVTISSNKLSEPVIEELHQKIRDLHKQNVEILVK
jgi:hypothetical protein